MVAIYVTKQWVKNIGAAADLILVETDMKGDFAILMAAEKSIDASSPFVHANALRRPSTVTAGKEPFIPVEIPAGEIAAIFDFSEADSKKMGFV